MKHHEDLELILSRIQSGLDALFELAWLRFTLRYYASGCDVDSAIEKGFKDAEKIYDDTEKRFNTSLN